MSAKCTQHSHFNLGALAAGLLAASIAQADQILVPGEQPTIQAGINAAVNGDEVVLADGVYTGAGNVNCTFGGKVITVRSASGDAQACIIDCQETAGQRGFLFNSGESGELRGITIRDANMTGLGSGGAVQITGTASPTITDCRFLSNAATSAGAIDVANTAALTLTGCDFVGNSSSSIIGAVGGGSLLTIRACRFVGNHAGSAAGALRFIGNGVAVNCLFNGNSAASFGGAIQVLGSGSVELANCTVVGNESAWAIEEDAGGGIWKSGTSTLTVVNSILRANLPNQIAEMLGEAEVRSSNVEGGWAGEGNVDDGVLYVDQLGADGIMGTIDDDLSLRGPSPCADSGDNALVPAEILTDLAGNPRFADSPDAPDNGNGRGPLVDMGCYEFQPPVLCLGDVNGDGQIDGADLGLLLGAWGACARE